MIGFVTQVYEVGDRYFKYKSTSLVHMNVPYEMRIPSVSVCFRLIKLLNREKIKSELNIDIPEKPNNNMWTNIFEQLEKLSVKNIFDYTPSTKEILSRGLTESDLGCSIRYPGNFHINSTAMKNGECRGFEISKYLHRFNLCYKIVVTLNHTLTNESNAHNDLMDLGENTLGPELPGIMYWVGFDNEIFGKISLVSVSVHGNDTSHLFDSIFGASLFHTVTRDTSGNILNSTYLSLDTSFNSMTIDKLKAPYDTNCLDYDPFRSRPEKMLSGIATEVMERLKMVPTFGPFIEPFELPIITSHHIRNKTVLRVIREAEKRHQTLNPDCHFKYHMYHITNIRDGRGKNVRVILKWPNNVDVVILYEKVQSFLDLVIYVSSSAGLWFGLSVIQIVCKLSHHTCAKKKHKSSTTDDCTSKQIRQLTKAHQALEEKTKLDRERIDKLEKENMLLTELIESG